VDGFDVREAREVFCVKGQYPRYSVNEHGGDEAGVVDLDAGDGVGDQETSPMFVDGGKIG
jgi:hypothetical protein